MRTRKQELVSDDLKPFVCNIMKEYREKYNYSLEDLARALNYKKNRQTLHKYETGTLNIPYEIFFDIANIFNITNTSTLSIIIRKLAHYTEYLILGILVINLNNNKNKGLYLSMIVCLLYAISDELHQYFVPGRSCQLVDVTIDFIGALTGIFIYKQTRNSNQ